MVLAVAKKHHPVARPVAMVVARTVARVFWVVARRLLGCSGWLLGPTP